MPKSIDSCLKYYIICNKPYLLINLKLKAYVTLKQVIEHQFEKKCLIGVNTIFIRNKKVPIIYSN